MFSCHRRKLFDRFKEHLAVFSTFNSNYMFWGFSSAFPDIHLFNYKGYPYCKLCRRLNIG